ncbi:2Fe-2S iron-sulfur cluster-binding protein, partial [Pseudomonas aeruginosa]
MHLLERQHDIQPLSRADMTIHLNGQPVAAAAGETVLNVLNAVGLRRLARNDHGQASGAFCGMGVCHCCLVAIDGRPADSTPFGHSAHADPDTCSTLI